MSEDELPDAHVRRSTIHGVTLGILMLDTKFQRLPGDIGNASTWPFPVMYHVVRGATVDRVVEGQNRGLLDAFLEGAAELVRLGVSGIGTSCGFLANLHPDLVERCEVPIATSSLLQIPMVQRLLPKRKKVGVITGSKEYLTPAHFAGVGVFDDIPVVGHPPEGMMPRNHRIGKARISYSECEAEVLALARRLLQENPDVGAIVSECTNFAPYSHAITRAFGVPVFDVVTMLTWFHAGLKPRDFRSAWEQIDASRS